MKDFKLILVDPNPLLCTAWRKHFRGLSNVTVINDQFESLAQFDCMVSAANSFGLMDGGVDLAIISYFGIELMDKVQAYILSEYLREQPVGTSFIIETDHPNHPYLAHTPTMRIPMAIATTDNVYCAMWAMLIAVHKHNLSADRKITSVACPGLGTATGRVPVEEAARQMNLAYRWYRNPMTSINWPIAQARQSAIGCGGDID
jgi:O-acetyl-ADP-ribose deacetylase (regulator of RNase III)